MPTAYLIVRVHTPAIFWYSNNLELCAPGVNWLIEPPKAPQPPCTFSQTYILPSLLKVISEIGYEAPTIPFIKLPVLSSKAKHRLSLPIKSPAASKSTDHTELLSPLGSDSELSSVHNEK